MPAIGHPITVSLWAPLSLTTGKKSHIITANLLDLSNDIVHFPAQHTTTMAANAKIYLSLDTSILSIPRQVDSFKLQGFSRSILLKKNETFYQMTEGAHLNLAAANAGPGPNFINKEDKHCAWPTTTPVATSKIDNWPD